MAPRKKQDDDAGQAEVQAKVDEATEKGYIGETPDPHPNSAHSLESGPDSPPISPRADTSAESAEEAA